MDLDPPLVQWGGLRASSYRKGKQTRPGQQQQQQHQAPSCCDYCGGPPHSSASREAREKECQAWGKECHTCHKTGHLAPVCKGKPKPSGNVANIEDSKSDGGQGNVEAFAFCPLEAGTRSRPARRQWRYRHTAPGCAQRGPHTTTKGTHSVPPHSLSLPSKGPHRARRTLW